MATKRKTPTIKRSPLVEAALTHLKKTADYKDGVPRSHMRGDAESGATEYALLSYVEELEKRPKAKPKKAADKRGALITRMLDLLREVQARDYHNPDTDAMQYCFGCGGNPNHTPKHSDDCIVVRIAQLLDEV
jgi:hypothetical protein